MSDTRIEGEDEIKEWAVIFEHIDGLFPVFGERGYSRDTCLLAWILRERIKQAQESDEEEE